MGACCSDAFPPVDALDGPVVPLRRAEEPSVTNSSVVFTASVRRTSAALVEVTRQRVTSSLSVDSDGMALFTPRDDVMRSSADMFNAMGGDELDLTLSMLDYTAFDPQGQLTTATPRSSAPSLEALIAREEERRATIVSMYDVAVTLMGLYVRRITPLFRVVPQRGAGRVGEGPRVRAATPRASQDGGFIVCHRDVLPFYDSLEAEVPRGSHLVDAIPPPSSERPAGNDAEGSDASPLSPSPHHARGDNHPTEDMERIEILSLTARHIPPDHRTTTTLVTTWDPLSLPTAVSTLNQGDAFFKFVCQPMSSLSAEDLAIVDGFVNVSAFSNEVSENGVPLIDVHRPEDLAGYTAILVRAMYLLPCRRGVETFTKERLASLEYQRACQPGKPKFYDVDAPLTFRQSKSVIPWVYSITVQMRVSEVVERERLSELAFLDGMCPARAIVMERTKRNVSARDSTAKVKSLLLYYPVTGGVLVSHVTIVVNSSLPTVVAKVIQSFGGQGSAETSEATDLTRKYLQSIDTT